MLDWLILRLRGPIEVLSDRLIELEGGVWDDTPPAATRTQITLEPVPTRAAFGDEQARGLEAIQAGNARLGVEQPVLLAYGDPAEGFYFVGPVIPNDPELDRFVNQELHNSTWWYLPLRTLAQAWEGND